MVDIIPALLLVVGLVALGKPEWVAMIDRRQKAAGTTRRPSDVELTDTYYAVVRVAGLGLALVGLIFLIQSL